jgi:hypothetical protein
MGRSAPNQTVCQFTGGNCISTSPAVSNYSVQLSSGQHICSIYSTVRGRQKGGPRPPCRDRETKQGRDRCHLLLNQRWHIFSSYSSNESRTGRPKYRRGFATRFHKWLDLNLDPDPRTNTNQNEFI